MKVRAKRRVVSGEPYHVEHEIDMYGKFTLTFFTEKHKIRLTFHGWWARFLAKPLWAVVAHQKRELAENESALRGGA